MPYLSRLTSLAFAIAIVIGSPLAQAAEVKVAEHAFDGVLQQGLVVHRFDIRGFDPVHDLGKGAQLFQRQESVILRIFFLVGQRQARCCQACAGNQQA